MLSIRPRFSIAALMGFVFVFGVGLAAFRYPNKLWASFLLSITLGALVVGLLGAVFHRGLPQKFWAGYAIVGWLYLLLSLSPWIAELVSPYLFTTACLDLIYPHVAAPEQTAMIAADAGVFGLAGGFGGGATPAAPAPGIWEHWTGLDSAARGLIPQTTLSSIDPCHSRSSGIRSLRCCLPTWGALLRGDLRGGRRRWLSLLHEHLRLSPGNRPAYSSLRQR